MCASLNVVEDASEELISTRQAAEEHQVTPQTINRWVREKRLTPVLQSYGDTGTRFYRRADVAALVKDKAQQAS